MFNQDSGGATSSGGFYICFMNIDGTVKELFKHGDVMPNELSLKTTGKFVGGVDMIFNVRILLLP